MKVSKIIGTLLLTIAILICSSNFFRVFAVDHVWDTKDKDGKYLYEPEVLKSSTSVNKIFNTVSSTLMVIGILAIVVGLTFIGFDMIIGSASEKAISKEKFIGIIVAGLLLTSGTTIANFIAGWL